MFGFSFSSSSKCQFLKKENKYYLFLKKKTYITDFKSPRKFYNTLNNDFNKFI